MGCSFFSVKFGNAFAYFMVSCSLARWCYYSIFTSKQSIILTARPKLCLTDCGRHGKYIFRQESFYLILNDINEQDTSFLDCKHNYMMKNGAPPDKVGVLYLLLPIEFHGFPSITDF